MCTLVYTHIFLIFHKFHTCKFSQSIRFIYKLPYQYSPCFLIIHINKWVVKNLSCLVCIFPVTLSKVALPSCLVSHCVINCPIYGLLVLCISQLCASCWWFCCSKWLSRLLLKCSPVFSRAKKLWWISQNTGIRQAFLSLEELCSSLWVPC